MRYGGLKSFKNFLVCLEPFDRTQALRRRGAFAKKLSEHLWYGGPLPADFQSVTSKRLAKLDLMAWIIELALDESPEIQLRAKLLSRLLCHNEIFLEPLLAYLVGDTNRACSALRECLRKPRDLVEHVFIANWLRYLNNKADVSVKTRRPPVIPKVMQFWHEEPPPDVEETMTQWRNIVGEENYTLYNTKSGCDYIKKQLGPTEARLFNSSYAPTPQSDTLRLVHLLFEGGFYIDADFEPAKQPLPFLEAGAELEFFMTQSSRILCANAAGLIGVKKNNPVLELCVETVFEIWADNSNLSPMVYGPYLLRWAMHQVDPEAKLSFLTCSKKHSDEYFLRNFKPEYKSNSHWRHRWRNYENKVETMDWAKQSE